MSYQLVFEGLIRASPVENIHKMTWRSNQFRKIYQVASKLLKEAAALNRINIHLSKQRQLCAVFKFMNISRQISCYNFMIIILQKNCADLAKVRKRFRPSLFQHEGYHSSLPGKVQKLKVFSHRYILYVVCQFYLFTTINMTGQLEVIIYVIARMFSLSRCL